MQQILNAHLEGLYEFHGEITGVRMARKQFAWHLEKNLAVSAETLKQINETLEPQQLLERVNAVFEKTENGLAS